MLLEVTKKVLAGENLSFLEANAAVNSILDGSCSEVAVAGFLTAMAAKGEIGEEVAGMARALRDHAVPVRPKSAPLLDIVGTGGDGSGTFNISTTTAFVVAGAGVAVAKHGNRAITSQCGSADILHGLGVKIDAAPDVIERCIDEAGIGFMFAPNHHPTMKYVQPVRKALGFRTVFNVLGPLANPANVSMQVVGVAKPELLTTMAEALKTLGVKRAMVVYGDGMDEFTTCGPSDIMELRDGKLTSHVIDYSDYGLARASLEDIKGGSLEDNVALTRGILDGSMRNFCTDVVLFNAAASIMMVGKASGIAEGLELARTSIADGAAMQCLENMVEISNQ
ncbi:MAG: anthranilate phosphoribosyltransferase [Sedimentisphaerales bacterium]|nr:anthranilate phosphoribosyltransferase [Sedimentisphaerales bacterium]